MPPSSEYLLLAPHPAANIPEIADVHRLIRETLLIKLGDEANRTRILYGGSVGPKNAAEIFSAPLTWVALAVIAAGMGLYALSLRQPALGKPFGWLGWAAEHSFGFEWINSQVVRLTQTFAETLRKTQTGKLNWNVFGIIAGLVVVLVIMLVGH